MATIPRTVRTKCCNHKAIGPPMVTDVAVFRPWEFGTFAPAAPELRATQCREGALAPLTGCGYVRSGMRCASTDGTWGLGLGLGATCAPETLNGELKPDNDLMEAWAGCIAREFRLIVRQRSGRYTPVRARYRLTVTGFQLGGGWRNRPILARPGCPQPHAHQEVHTHLWADPWQHVHARCRTGRNPERYYFGIHGGAR